jgi:hypothetical protein
VYDNRDCLEKNFPDFRDFDVEVDDADCTFRESQKMIRILIGVNCCSSDVNRGYVSMNKSADDYFQSVDALDVYSSHTSLELT